MGWRARFQGHPLLLFPDFRRLYGGRFVSAVGDKVFTIALAWWVVDQAGEGNKLHLGLLMAVNMLPIVIFGPIMGTLVDRFDKRKCMLVADGVRFGLLLILVYLLATGSLTLTLAYPLVFCVAAFVPLFEGAAEGSLGAVTDREHLESAAAVNASVVELSNVIGAGVAGVALASLRTTGAFALDAATFALSFVLIASLRSSLRPVEGAAQESYGAQMKEGLAFLVKNRPIGALLALFGAVNFFAAPLLVLIPMVVKFMLKETATWVAVFEGSLSVGAVLAAIGVSFLPPGRTYVRIFAGLFAGAAAILAFALAGSKLAMAAALFLFGGTLALVNATAMALFQRDVPEAMKGRFFALLNTVACSVMPLTFMINGFLAERLDLVTVLVINGVGTLLMSFAALVIPRGAQKAA